MSTKKKKRWSSILDAASALSIIEKVGGGTPNTYTPRTKLRETAFCKKRQSWDRCYPTYGSCNHRSPFGNKSSFITTDHRSPGHFIFTCRAPSFLEIYSWKSREIAREDIIYEKKKRWRPHLEEWRKGLKMWRYHCLGGFLCISFSRVR